MFYHDLEKSGRMKLRIECSEQYIEFKYNNFYITITIYYFCLFQFQSTSLVRFSWKVHVHFDLIKMGNILEF